MQVPEGIDWAAVSKNAMDKYNVEIAGGLGPTAGKIWCVAHAANWGTVKHVAGCCPGCMLACCVLRGSRNSSCALMPSAS